MSMLDGYLFNFNHKNILLEVMAEQRIYMPIYRRYMLLATVNDLHIYRVCEVPFGHPLLHENLCNPFNLNDNNYERYSKHDRNN